MTVEREQITEARHRLAVAAGAALLGAGLILVMFVLPAEFGVDPLGTGARAGLLPLGITGQQVQALEQSASAGAGQAVIVVPQEKAFNSETVEFMVAPREGLEYKYRLDKGEALLYSWKATGPVNFEFHAEPDGAPRGYAQSYEKRQASQASGTLTAPFAGIHGWYWENIGDRAITVTLTSAGYYNLAHEFRAGQPVRNKMFQ
ncbi:MAG: hypothetical protein HY824_16970 [Acidobacteria bacterium]|nr:hypothetical protein [Acidobacteriota bacterium]